MASPSPSPGTLSLPFQIDPGTAIADVWQKAVPIGIVLVVCVAAVRLSQVFVHRLIKALMDREATEGTAQELSAVELKKRMDTLDGLASSVLSFFIIMIAALMILDRLDLNIGPAIAGFGIVGIAVGFGAQHLVSDYLNGALILVENQFGKGDVVRVAGVAGTVEDFSLRRTTLRDMDGTVHTVPNGQIMVASNLTRTWARINQDVQVVYGTDIEKAIAAVNEVGSYLAADPDWRRRILEPPRVERVEALGEYGITLKILGTVRAAHQWAVAGELRKRLLITFQDKGIEIPQPQRMILAGLAPAAAQAAGPSQEELAEGVD